MKNPIQKAVDRGIDMLMIEANLQRSVTERIRRHKAALNMIESFRKCTKEI